MCRCPSPRLGLQVTGHGLWDSTGTRVCCGAGGNVTGRGATVPPQSQPAAQHRHRDPMARQSRAIPEGPASASRENLGPAAPPGTPAVTTPVPPPRSILAEPPSSLRSPPVSPGPCHPLPVPSIDQSHRRGHGPEPPTPPPAPGRTRRWPKPSQPVPAEAPLITCWRRIKPAAQEQLGERRDPVQEPPRGQSRRRGAAKPASTHSSRWSRKRERS